MCLLFSSWVRVTGEAWEAGQAGGPRDKEARERTLEAICLLCYPCGLQVPGKGQRRPQGCSAGVEGREQIVLVDCMTKAESFSPVTQAFSVPFWSSCSFLPGSGPSLSSIWCGCTWTGTHPSKVSLGHQPLVMRHAFPLSVCLHPNVGFLFLFFFLNVCGCRYVGSPAACGDWRLILLLFHLDH